MQEYKHDSQIGKTGFRIKKVELKELFYLIAILPIFFLVIYVLFMVLKKPGTISKSSSDALRDRPSSRKGLHAFLSIFYSLDELAKTRKYRLIYLAGVVGIIAAAIYIIIFTIVTYFIFYNRETGG